MRDTSSATIAGTAGTSPDRTTPESSPDTTGADTTGPDTSTASTDSPTGPVDVEAIEWGDCPAEDAEIAEDESIDCATLTVPLDYDDPSGETIDLALVRAPARSDREGAVLLNPGGPGGSGVDPILYSGLTLSDALGLENFDLIGFDPRGVDRSGGISCVDDATQDKYLYVDNSPDTPEEQALEDEAETAFVDGCHEHYGDTLRFYSTENTARDMDLIRQALGDDQVSFLGISYGTYLGAVFAARFPDTVRAMVLDSAFDPEGDTPGQELETQLVGFETAFGNWADWCQTTDSCAFHADDVGARWDTLRDQLDAAPVTTEDGRTVNQAVLEIATIASLYADSDWPVLASALAGAESGDGASLLALADAYEGRSPDGTFSSLFQSLPVIECASGIESDDVSDPEAFAAHLHEVAPRFARDLTPEDLVTDPDESCAALIGTEVELPSLSFDGDAPVVVIGGANDPATPLRWAEELTERMGTNARLVVYTGEGHGQLLNSTCVTDIQAAVLSNLELPDEGTTCDPDPPVEMPSWWDDLPTPEGVSEPTPLPAVLAGLGLTESLAYSETRLTADDRETAMDTYVEALEDTGFAVVGQPDAGIPDTSFTVLMNVEGDALLVMTLGPGAWEHEALTVAGTEVPEGQTAIVLAYVPR